MCWCESANEPRSARVGKGLQLGAETGRRKQGKEDRKQGWSVWDLLFLSAIRHYGLNCLWNCSLGMKLYAHFKLKELFTAARRRKSSQLQGPTTFAGSCQAVACNPSLHYIPAGFPMWDSFLETGSEWIWQRRLSGKGLCGGDNLVHPGLIMT